MFKLMNQIFGMVLFVLITVFQTQANPIESNDFSEQAKEIRAQAKKTMNHASHATVAIVLIMSGKQNMVER